jgi:hypothetical protein
MLRTGMTLALLTMTLGCNLGGLMGGGGGDDEDDDDNNDPVDRTVPQVFSISRDANGQTTDAADEADLCPAGSTYLGGAGYAAACLDEGVKGIVSLLGDTSGRTFPEDLDDEAALCPSGSTHVGGNGYYATCVQAAPVVTYEIFANASGDTVDDVGLDACSDGAVGYGVQGSAVCTVAGQLGVALLDTRPDGTTSDEVDDKAEMCPAGWRLGGTWWYGAAMCIGPEGTVYTLTRNVAGDRLGEVDDIGTLCPSGTEWVGSYYGAPTCFEAKPRTVVALQRAASGETAEDVSDEAELCPDGWEHIGGYDYMTYCRR